VRYVLAFGLPGVIIAFLIIGLYPYGVRFSWGPATQSRLAVGFLLRWSMSRPVRNLPYGFALASLGGRGSSTHMTKHWLITLLIVGLFGGKAFADCAPSPDTPASVIEYFQRFNKPLPEQFCAKRDAAPQASVELPPAARQAYEREAESAENPRVSADRAHGEQAKAALEQSKPQPIVPQAGQSPHAITPEETTVPPWQIEATQTPKPQPKSSQDLARQPESSQEPGEELRVTAETSIRSGPSASAAFQRRPRVGILEKGITLRDGLMSPGFQPPR
jgi:hypothetical protein